MSPEELQEEIDELKKTLEEQEDRLNERLDTLERKPAVDRYLSNQEKDILQDVMSDRILEVIWDDYFYYFSSFESLDRYLTPATGAVQTINDTGMVLTTDGSGSNETGFILKFISSALLSVDKEARFRVENEVSSITEVVWEALTLQDSGATHYIGFQMKNGIINGLSKDGSTEKVLAIGTYSANTKVVMELRYYPKERIDFYVDGIIEGTITTNLPTAAPERIFDIGIGETSASARTSITSFYEFIQRK